MRTVKSIMDEICAEGVTGQRDYCDDYSRGYVPPERVAYEPEETRNEDLPPISNPLRLVKRADGTLKWVD